MTKVNAFVAIDMIEDRGPASGNVVENTSSRIVIEHGSGFMEVYEGKGFTYDEFGLTGGTLTGFRAYHNGAVSLQVSGGSVDAVTAAGLILAGDLQTLFRMALARHDTIIGSSQDDVLLGFNGNDTISGGGGADSIAGMNGDDQLAGGGGADRLAGLAGADQLTGGSFGDKFVFSATAHSSRTVSDTITDFNTGPDVIVLNAIDAKASAAGNNAFTFIDQQQFTGEGQIRAVQSGDDTIIQVNTSSAAGIEMRIVLADTIATTINVADFIL